MGFTERDLASQPHSTEAIQGDSAGADVVMEQPDGEVAVVEVQTIADSADRTVFDTDVLPVSNPNSKSRTRLLIGGAFAGTLALGGAIGAVLSGGSESEAIPSPEPGVSAEPFSEEDLDAEDGGTGEAEDNKVTVDIGESGEITLEAEDGSTIRVNEHVETGTEQQVSSETLSDPVLIEEIYALRETALATGNKELLNSVYATENGDRKVADENFIDRVAEEFGTSDYGDKYSYVQGLEFFPGSFETVESSDDTIVVQFRYYKPIDNIVYSSIDTITKNENGNWEIFSSDITEIGTVFDVCDGDLDRCGAK
jgi:hypothetical protein